LGLRMPRAGPWRRRGHQDVNVQMLFYKVAESRAVDELDPMAVSLSAKEMADPGTRE
jgi:hypothetical protein